MWLGGPERWRDGVINRPIAFDRGAKAADKRLYFLSVGFLQEAGLRLGFRSWQVNAVTESL